MTNLLSTPIRRARPTALDVTIDTLTDHEVTIDTQGLVSARRTAIVQNLTGSPAQKLWSAIHAKGLPVWGDPHQVIPGIFVNSVTAKLLSDSSTTQAQITIIYNAPGATTPPPDFPPDPESPPMLSIETSLISARTSRDVHGNPIVVRYSPPLQEGEIGPTTVQEQTGEVDLLIPSEVVVFRRREVRNPHDKARAYLRHVNADEVFDDPPGYWLVTKLSGDTDDRGATFNVTYEFQRNPDTWRATVIYIDPATGRPPGDIWDSSGNLIQVEAVKEVDLYPSIAFQPLSLTL